ncbi:MAG: protein kinase, partial [Planctomycetota bacterium]
MADLTGRRLGDYQILRRLGAGGMADVYAARQLALQRDVALKILRAESNPKPDDQRRFRREAQAAAQLNHPAIVQVYDIGEIESSHFIAQELIDGKNLNQ